jgi:lipopolysaccharide biosynthesis protein
MIESIRQVLLKVSRASGIHPYLKRMRAARWERAEIARSPSKGFSELKTTSFEGDFPQKRSENLCLFSSFDIHSQVGDHVVYYLKAIREQLGADIVFVSTSHEMPPVELAKLKPLCRKIIHRENVGHDFGSWKTAMILAPDWKAYAVLVLANDSVFGPFSDLRAVLEPLRSKTPTLVGITENFEIDWHLQSYFLAMNRALIETKFFRQFWDSFRFYTNRELVIRLYELGFSRRAAKAGCRMVALFPYEKMKEALLKNEPESFAARHAATRAVNSTHYLWKELIVRWKGPFLKVDLVRSNPISGPDVGTAAQVVAEHTNYPVELIEKHVKRVRTQGDWARAREFGPESKTKS